jgi:acyl-CoA dehydrogenase
MDFALSQEQKDIQELALKFARNEMIPHAQEMDDKGIFPHDIFKEAWELGLTIPVSQLNMAAQVLVHLMV